MAKKEITEEIENTMVKEEDFLDEKRKFHVGKIIFNFIFWAIILVLLFTWIMDYINVRNDKKPAYCIKNISHKFEDGTVDECVGLGYKVFTYNRDSMAKASEFVPFFIGMKKSSK